MLAHRAGRPERELQREEREEVHEALAPVQFRAAQRARSLLRCSLRGDRATRRRGGRACTRSPSRRWWSAGWPSRASLAASRVWSARVPAPSQRCPTVLRARRPRRRLRSSQRRPSPRPSRGPLGLRSPRRAERHRRAGFRSSRSCQRLRRVQKLCHPRRRPIHAAVGSAAATAHARHRARATIGDVARGTAGSAAERPTGTRPRRSCDRRARLLASSPCSTCSERGPPAAR
jgi:hypothetical protein